MEQKQFADSMGYLGLAYGKSFTQQEIMQYYDFLKMYNDDIFTKAIKSIIRSSKFLPKITDLIEECEKHKGQIKNDVIDFMQKRGYFKHPYEYEKALGWLENEIIPQWFKKDMSEYYKMMKQQLLGNDNYVLLEQKENI